MQHAAQDSISEHMDTHLPAREESILEAEQQSGILLFLNT